MLFLVLQFSISVDYCKYLVRLLHGLLKLEYNLSSLWMLALPLHAASLIRTRPLVQYDGYVIERGMFHSKRIEFRTSIYYLLWWGNIIYLLSS